MKSTTRLKRLEAETGPISTSAEDDRYTQWVYALCQGSPLLEAIERMADARGARRALLEGRYPVSMIVPRQDRYAWRHAEINALAHHYHATGDLWLGLEAWCNEPDREGWPDMPTYGQTPDGLTGYERFFVWMQIARRRVDGNRRGERAAGWRADNPGWHQDMDDAEFLTWDLDRIDAAIIRGDF